MAGCYSFLDNAGLWIEGLFGFSVVAGSLYLSLVAFVSYLD